jgi:hypothetical protein
MAVKMIDGRNLFSGPITHETKMLMVTIGSHSNKVVFKSSPTNPIIIGLSWLILCNAWVDWKTMNFHFELINEITPKYKAFPRSTLDFEHDYAHENIARTSQCM